MTPSFPNVTLLEVYRHWDVLMASKRPVQAVDIHEAWRRSFGKAFNDIVDCSRDRIAVQQVELGRCLRH